ncbi:MAG: small subunit ribosomal protein S4 [Bacteroidia bacterium]|jgi:small subunit ribosomal protein S4
MARYTGPKSKIARKFKEPIFGPDKVLDRKNYPPGMHGNARRRGKKSEYSMQLAEKQKAKYTYGVLEKQFANTFQKAARKKGITGENLLKFLESRLDNTVYRLGIAKTRRGARQLVAHKHLMLNGVVTNVASCQIKPGDVISVREKSKSIEFINESLASRGSFSWITWDSATYSGTFLNYPERTEIPENIKEQLIVELYSK